MGYTLISEDLVNKVAVIKADGCNKNTSLILPDDVLVDGIVRNNFYNQKAAEVLAALTYDSPDYDINSGMLETPPLPSQPSAIEVMRVKAVKRMNFGVALYLAIAKEVLAVNMLSAAQGSPLTIQQVQALGQQSVTLKALLESGSFETTIQFLTGIKAVFPQYTNLADDAISKIQSYIAAE